jgi:hypothetical protein
MKTEELFNSALLITENCHENERNANTVKFTAVKHRDRK